MRRFIRHILAYALPLLVALVALEWGVESIPNSYTYKYHYMEHHAGIIRTLVLGSSHAYDGIDPSLLPDGFSLANSSQSMEDDYRLLEKYIDRMDSLQIVVLPISYVTMALRTEKYRRTYYTIYMDLYPRWPLSRYSLEVCDLELLTKKIVKYCLSSDVTRCDSLGMRVGHTAAARDRGDEGWNKDLQSMVHKDSFLPQYMGGTINHNWNYLVAILHLCQEHSVRLMVVNMPVQPEYKAQLPKEQIALMDEVLMSLDSVAICADASDFPMEPNDWYNATHLTPDGARKLTEWVREIP